MSQIDYLSLMGIDQWRLRTPQVEAQPLEKTSEETAAKRVETNAKLVETTEDSASINVNTTPQVTESIENKPIEPAEVKTSHSPCPLCINLDTTPNHLVVSDAPTGRWYWLVEGKLAPLLEDIINASKTQARDDDKALDCRSTSATCKDTLLARMGGDDALIIVGLTMARLILGHNRAFDFEANIGQQAGQVWQLENCRVVVIPSINAMQADRRNKKQAWLNIQQVMAS